MQSKKFIIALSLLLVQAHASAGSVEGLYIVWFNLAEAPAAAAVDLKMRQHIESGKSQCWEDGSLLFMRDKPKTITHALVASAILHKDQQAIKTLNALLAQPHGDEATGGFDGIVVYHDKPAPRLYSLTTRRRRIEQVSLHPVKDPQTLGRSFCDVRPPVSRLP